MNSKVLTPGRSLRKKKKVRVGVGGPDPLVDHDPPTRLWSLWASCTQTLLPVATHSLGTPNGLFPPLVLLLSFLFCRQLLCSITNLSSLGERVHPDRDSPLTD